MKDRVALQAIAAFKNRNALSGRSDFGLIQNSGRCFTRWSRKQPQGRSSDATTSAWIIKRGCDPAVRAPELYEKQNRRVFAVHAVYRRGAPDRASHGQYGIR
jgi:hypothetical protein